MSVKNKKKDELLDIYYALRGKTPAEVKKAADADFAEGVKKGKKGVSVSKKDFTAQVITMHKIAKACTNEKEWLEFMQDGEAPPVKLSSGELGALQGGALALALAGAFFGGISGRVWDA